MSVSVPQRRVVVDVTLKERLTCAHCTTRQDPVFPFTHNMSRVTGSSGEGSNDGNDVMPRTGATGGSSGGGKAGGGGQGRRASEFPISQQTPTTSVSRVTTTTTPSASTSSFVYPVRSLLSNVQPAQEKTTSASSVPSTVDSNPGMSLGTSLLHTSATVVLNVSAI